MNWHQVSLDAAAAAPWRNGGGTTRELLAWPHQAQWLARVSVADIDAGGPFSSYPGVERWFAVLAGAGVRLRIGTRQETTHADASPLCFDGAEPVVCELVDGPTRDFNLMLRGSHGRLERIAGAQQRTCRQGALVGIYSHEHEVTLRAVEVRIVIPPRTLAWRVVSTDEHVDFISPAALWFEVQP